MFEICGLSEKVPRVPQHTTAHMCQRDALGVMADEQLDTQLILKFCNGRRDGGLGNIGARRRFGEALALGCNHKVVKLAEGEFLHVAIATGAQSSE